MDVCDRAKEYEQRDRAAALAAAVVGRTSQPKQLRDGDGRVICLDCRDLIPEARLAVKPDAARCLECKTVFESRQKGNQ